MRHGGGRWVRSWGDVIALAFQDAELAEGWRWRYWLNEGLWVQPASKHIMGPCEDVDIMTLCEARLPSVAYLLHEFVPRVALIWPDRAYVDGYPGRESNMGIG